jgi:hypothetical protein
MNKVIPLCVILLALSATAASAGRGVNLRWTDCYGDGGSINRSFACNTNSGNQTLVCSFELGADLPRVDGLEIVVDLASAGTTLPAWWQLHNAGTCRVTSLSVSSVISPLASNCIDWASGQAVSGLAAYQVGQSGPNTARMKIATAVAQVDIADLVAGQEYFAINVTINNAKTVGTGSCAGCSTPVCIVLNSIRADTITPGGASGPTVTLSGPTNGTDSDFAVWQGGSGVVVGSKIGCPAATPTINRTWGMVKTLYR